MNNYIDIRSVTTNLINRYYDKIDHDVLKSVLHQLNHLNATTYKMSTQDFITHIKTYMNSSTNDNMRKLYADCWAYVEYISGLSTERILKPLKPIPLCARRNSDTCAIYCDGFDTSCESYITDDDLPNGYIGVCTRFEEDSEYEDNVAIEVCSFEEGDPQ